jgi:hypothetical protein
MKFMENPKWYWLRWIGILPLACLAYILGYLLLILMNWLSIKFYSDSNGDGGWISLYVWPVTAIGAASYYFVFLGTHIAPNNKKTVALILLIILCMVSGAAVMGIFITRNWSIVFAAIAQIVGGAIAYHNDGNDFDN